jgi:hypothetical protein
MVLYAARAESLRPRYPAEMPAIWLELPRALDNPREEREKPTT